MSLFELKAEDIDRDAHREASRSEAKLATESFPRLIAEILAIFRKAYPPHVMATLAFWGLIHPGGPHGVSTTSVIKGIEQHHIELLQALLLTLDEHEWGTRPATDEQIQQTIDAIRDLTTAFSRRRAAQFEECADDLDQLTVIGLQERMRDYTQMVRNWSTHSEMLGIVRSLHDPLDAAFAAFHGYSANDLADVVEALVKLHQERTSTHFTLLKSIFRARTKKAIVHDFFARFEGMQGNPDDFLASLHKRTSVRDVKMILRSHIDWWLYTYMMVDPAFLAERTGKQVGIVVKVFEALGMRPGALREKDPEHLFLANPVWAKPAMYLGGECVFFSPQGIVHFLPTILRDLFKQAGLAKKLEKRRTGFLEDEMTRVVVGLLPSARVRPNVKWFWQGVEYETDLLAIVDRVILIGEAKSGTLAPGALRGGPRSVRDQVNELLVDPALQSERLSEILLAARSGDGAALAVVEGLELGIEPNRVDKVLRVSVTLDDFSALSSAQAELKQAGWLPQGTILPPTMQLAELRMVAHILDDPAYFLNYLTSREAIQGGLAVFGFELDFLGAYLQSGLDLPEIATGTHKGVFRNMSQEIDRYTMSREAGYSPDKPRPRVDPYIETVLASLRERATPGWMIKSLALLDAVPPGSGDGFGDMMDEMAQEVLSNGLDPNHRSTVAVSGPGQRAVAMFHVFPRVLADGLEEKLSLLAEDAMSGSPATICVAFARMLERWDRPFQTSATYRVSADPTTEGAS
jgi:hypothetical protein